MGRLTRNPELRYTNNKTPVASFTLAVDRGYADADGQRTTDFIDCVAWKSTGEFAHKYFAKGKMAVVEGRLQIRTWTDDKGNKRKAAEVNVASMYFADSKERSDNGDEDNYTPVTSDDFKDIDDDDCDLPI